MQYARVIAPFLLVLSTVWISACSNQVASPVKIAPVPIDPARLVDLTYTFDSSTIYWPNAEGFRHRKDTWAVTPGGYWYAAGEFTTAEHGGTHVDSPVHFSQGKRTLDQIPVSDLVGTAVVIDVSKQAAADTDYRVTAEDIENWEKQNQPLGPGEIVLFRTGWGARWPDRRQYLGDDTPGDITHLHFPGLSEAAAQALASRMVKAVGIDTASLDYGPSKDFIVHQVLNGANIYGIENIANLSLLPATGATLIVMPVKVGEGSGGPARVVGLLP